MRPAQTLALILALSAFQPDDAVARKRKPTFALASETMRPIVCTDQKTKDKIRAIMLNALDEALNDRVVNLYEVWMKDLQGQPARARKGIEQGIEAYVHGQRAIQQWDMMLCERD